MQPTRLQPFLGAALLGAGISLCQATPIVSVMIDDFSVDQYQKVTGNSGCSTFDTSAGCNVVQDPDTQVAGPTSSILGGYRDVYIEKSGFLGTSVAVGPGYLDHNNWMSISNDAITQGEATLVWDGAHQLNGDPDDNANIDTDGLGGIDFLPWSSSHGILLEVWTIDLNVTATLDLWDMDGDLARVSHTFGAPKSHVFEFSDFLSDNPLLDLHDIGAVRLSMNGPESWDGTFNLVGVVASRPNPTSIPASIPVPAPAALLIFGLALLGLGKKSRGKNTG